MMDKLWKILVVDDQTNNLEVLRGLLGDTYTMAFAKNGERALEAARRHRPNLILLDIMMPDIDGYEVCRRLKADPELCHIPVIFVTALGESVDEAKGFEAGAVDYITKPVSGAVVRARVRTHLTLVDQETVLDRLGMACEFKDNETGAHVRRMGCYAEIMVGRLGWCESAAQAIKSTAPMHDVGKVGIPDSILLKPGRLDPDELTQMQTHPELGAAIIGANGSVLMQMASRIALAHHEKWDGTGYPHRLAGADIPIEGRIVAIADVFDALMSKRPYKEAWPLENVVAYIKEQSGRHFDPTLVGLFLDSVDAFRAINISIHD